MKKTASKDTTFKHWKLSTDIDNVLWLSLDREGENANSLSLEVLSELGTIIDKVETNAPAGLVLQSAKSGSFIVGADVREKALKAGWSKEPPLRGYVCPRFSLDGPGRRA